MTRKAVQTFSESMEQKLILNDRKGGWDPDKCSYEYLRKRLIEEVLEFLRTGEVEELVDISNFSMMLWTRKRKLGKEFYR